MAFSFAFSEKSFAAQEAFFFFPSVSLFQKSVSRSRGSWARKFSPQLTGHWFSPSCFSEHLCLRAHTHTPTRTHGHLDVRIRGLAALAGQTLRLGVGWILSPHAAGSSTPPPLPHHGPPTSATGLIHSPSVTKPQPHMTEAPAGRKPSADTHAGHSESQGSVGSGVGAGPGARCLHSPLSVTTFDISAANLTPLCFVTFAFSVQ